MGGMGPGGRGEEDGEDRSHAPSQLGLAAQELARATAGGSEWGHQWALTPSNRSPQAALCWMQCQGHTLLIPTALARWGLRLGP